MERAHGQDPARGEAPPAAERRHLQPRSEGLRRAAGAKKAKGDEAASASGQGLLFGDVETRDRTDRWRQRRRVEPRRPQGGVRGPARDPRHRPPHRQADRTGAWRARRQTSSVAFSPDGKTLISGGSDDVVRVWRLPDEPALDDYMIAPGAPYGRLQSAWRQVPRVGRRRQPDPVVGTRYPSHNRRAVQGPRRENQRGPWSLTAACSPRPRTRRRSSLERRDPESDLTLRGHTAGVRSVVFSPDGRLLLSAERITRCDSRTSGPGSPLRRSTDTRAGSTALRSAATEGSSPRAAPRDPVAVGRQDARPIVALEGHTLAVTAVAFSPTAATWRRRRHDRPALGREIAPPGRTRVHRPYRARVGRRFLGDGRTLASAGADKTLRLWDVATTCRSDPA